MLTLLSTIFGSKEIIKSGVDLIDSFHTSEEEQIEAKTKAKVELLNAYAPFKLAQRVLATMFSTIFLLSFILVLGMTLAGVGNPDDVKQVLSEFWIGEIMLAIIGFYFGGGFADSIKRKTGA